MKYVKCVLYLIPCLLISLIVGVPLGILSHLSAWFAIGAQLLGRVTDHCRDWTWEGVMQPLIKKAEDCLREPK